VGDFGACDAAAALGAVQAAERVAADARDFMNKPDGGAWVAHFPVNCVHYI
jgi:hypothetical protein